MTDIEAAGFDAEPDPVAASLGAYLDDELPAAKREAVALHLRNCPACRRELRAQTALRDRLAHEGTPRLSPALRGRIRAVLQAPAINPPAHQAARRSPGVVALLPGWLGWGAAAVLALLLLGRPAAKPAAPAMAMSMGPAMPVALDSVPVPVIDSVLADFRRVAASDLPGSSLLAGVTRRVPFGVPALTAPHMRLIGAWTTDIEQQPVAVLAYRCHDRLVVQYVISEQQFFRVARIREAIARAGLYAAGRDGVHAIAWPGPDSGSLLVGAFSAGDLAAMRS